MRGNFAYCGCKLVTISQIKCPAFGLATGLCNFLNNCGDPFGVTIKDRNLSTFIGKQVSGCAAHAASGSSDESNFSGDRSAEFGQSWHRFFYFPRLIISLTVNRLGLIG